MTSRMQSHHWLDVLYNDVRRTPGGVKDAARFLSERRGKSIHYESLRAKLSGQEGESLNFETATFLTEWMQEKAGGAEYACNWLQTYATVEHGLVFVPVPPAPVGGHPNELAALLQKILQAGMKVGNLNTSYLAAVDDGRIDPAERSQLHESFWDLAVLCLRAIRNLTRVSS
ncbi:hypothetical protein D0838_04985 [Bordetella avium]|uniref:hypothetical protein n=1 Tax=Bordetella avium TaxID=521 RepID=UPI000E6818EC|nr:hypothetical protein [Bordetella avium]AZY50105.1 hypothetical protein C0J09_13960 [Bordetella avium]RIQ74556.1 hypothetical protein D0838_04985 [Bordetella avium]